jgi:hypothetical protein
MADPLRLAAALAEIGIARYAQSELKRTGATLLLKVVSVAKPPPRPAQIRWC